MNRLIIDIGNTAAKVAIVKNNTILLVRRYDHLSEEQLLPLINLYAPTAAIVSSVRNQPEEAMCAFLKKNIKKVIPLTSKTLVPIRNLYGTPETLGRDRLAAAVGAYALFPEHHCMIIDCGTAITIDFLTNHREFLGGNISPGLQTRFQALHNFTGQLPLGSVTDDVPAIGTTTTEAIEAGVLQGALLEIEGYIEQNPDYTPILTGGDAIFFAKRIKNPIFVICNLVIIGLNNIAEYNAYL